MKHYLRSTGEQIQVLSEPHTNEKTNEVMLQCILPPQRKGHKPRYQNIHMRNVREVKD